MVDIMDHVAQVQVIEGDFWDSGKTNRRLEQALLPADFKIE